MTKNVLNKLGFLGAVCVAAVISSNFCIKRIRSVAGAGRSRQPSRTAIG